MAVLDELAGEPSEACECRHQVLVGFAGAGGQELDHAAVVPAEPVADRGQQSRKAALARSASSSASATAGSTRSKRDAVGRAGASMARCGERLRGDRELRLGGTLEHRPHDDAERLAPACSKRGSQAGPASSAIAPISTSPTTG